MKLKILTKIVEKGLGKDFEDQEADMYLPTWLLAFGLVLIALGTAGILFFALQKNTDLLVICGAVFSLATGILACICWKNQKIRVISEEEFEYTTFLGNKYRLFFRDIRGLKRNNDSMTLLVGDKKVHMEALAHISDRLATSINTALKNLRNGK